MAQRRIRTVGFGLVAVLILLMAGFVLWAETPARALSPAMDALQSGASVEVEQDPWIVFRPQNMTPETGLILYPGGRVDPAAYSPLARSIASGGYLVVIVPMPLNLAVLDFDRAIQVQAAYPEIRRWVVGGHSLGGAMAAHFTYEHPSDVAGLVLWAAFSAAGDDLSGSSLAVLCISGSRDGLSTPQDIADARSRLPASTIYVEIEGGNHAQFGTYGPQPGDLPASISREDQQQQIVLATLDFLQEMETD